MQTLDVNKEISPESVTVMQDATEAKPAQASLLVGMAIAAFLGLVASFGLLMLLDRLDDRMNSFTELEELFDEPVIGQVPREKPSGRNNGDLALLQAEDERHAFLEAYRNIRSSLIFSNEAKHHPRIILVTSSIPNDGKSMTITNLAIVLALSGSKVLLVDADLRKGLLHERFGLKSGPGVSEVLQNNHPWRAALQTTHIDNLLLLPRGANTQRTGDLFLHEPTRSFLDEARNEFDYVLIDTAPVMAADDVTTLAPRVDGTIFVIRAQHTSARVARAALDLLDHRRANILGLVFNAVKASTGDYYYYHKYKDYYQSYPDK
jgi:capsular exopolysaccharide synthesis family protein